MTLIDIILVVTVVGLGLLTVALLAYVLAKLQIFFVIPTEGTAIPIERSGGGFDHFIMKWKGYTLNDPREPWYNPNLPDWEVVPWHPNDAARPPSIYRFPLYWLAPLWRFLERFGISYYGVYPFKQVGYYTFDWAEPHLKEGAGESEPWHRVERSWFVYVKSFVYWIRLLAAEDKDNIPLDLDYLLTIAINNPYKALYVISDWLARTSADANNKAKTFVGNSEFEELTKERRLNDQELLNRFSANILETNENVLTERKSKDDHTIGTQESYGVTIKAASLFEIKIAGENKTEIVKATTAQVVAEKNAKATVATAEGAAEAVRIAAKAEKDAIATVYSEISKYGGEGIAIRQLQAIERSSQNGSQIIWANNPILDAAKEVTRAFRPVTPPPPPPPAEPTPPTTPQGET